MQNLILKLVIAMVTKLLTERSVSKLTIRMLWAIAEKTPFEVDNGVIEDIAKTLEIKDYK